MRTLLNDPPEAVRSWLERRQALGQDLHDEVSLEGAVVKERAVPQAAALV